MQITQRDLIALVLGLIIGSLGVFWLNHLAEPTAAEKIADYYTVENLVAVSPYDIKTALQKNTQGDFVLVDLRTPEEYHTEHMTSAINVPNYVDAKVSGKDNSARLIEAFTKIKNDNPNKDIIMYCYSAACMASRKVGLLLSQNGITAKHLNIGWYEWKYYWTIWNGEDGTKAEDFITKGSEPGKPDLKDTLLSPCSENNEFGC